MIAVVTDRIDVEAVLAAVEGNDSGAVVLFDAQVTRHELARARSRLGLSAVARCSTRHGSASASCR